MCCFLRPLFRSHTGLSPSLFFLICRAATPSIDSGNPSECSPLNNPCREIQEPDDAIVAIEHADNFETDLSKITQKITSLRVTTPVSLKGGNNTSSSSNCQSPTSSEGGTFPQELIDNFALNLHRIGKLKDWISRVVTRLFKSILQTKTYKDVTETTLILHFLTWRNWEISLLHMFGIT